MFAPYEWNAIVVGRWNTAILTPKGIGKRLFGTRDDEPLEILVPLDGLEPYIVKHQGLAVSASDQRVSFQPDECSAPELDRARQLAVKTLRALPETPVSACGFNIRYRSPAPSRSFLEYLTSSLDDALSDEGYGITERRIRRTVTFGEGVINIDILSPQESNDQYKVILNFHRQTDSPAEQIEWLTTPVDQVLEQSDRICSLLNLETHAVTE